MVRSSTVVAGLALVANSCAGPLPQAEETLPPLPETEGIPAISLGAAIESAKEEAQTSTCTLDPQEASSWADSGAEQLVIDYLKANGAGTEHFDAIDGKPLTSSRCLDQWPHHQRYRSQPGYLLWPQELRPLHTRAAGRGLRQPGLLRCPLPGFQRQG
jgi:hypothetical protein